MENKPDKKESVKSDRVTGLFLHLVSRDLGEPFTAFRNKFDALMEEANPWALRENLKEMSGSVHRLDRVVRDLVDTAAIEGGSVRLKSEPVDLASILSGRISRRLRRMRGYRFQPEMPPHTPPIQSDKNRLITLIDDLFDVVILLSPGGGTILVHLSMDENEVRISAQNRSASIPAGASGSFLEWLRENLQEGGGLEGAGIGLYRSYLTAQLLGGRMDVETPPEGGASITVRFPYIK
jgi:signal transduction histidine kinase